MATNAQRQAEFRKRMKAQGYVQVTGWVKANQASDVMILMKRLAESDELEIGPVRNVKTGKLQRL